jgi:hypothetical protein
MDIAATSWVTRSRSRLLVWGLQRLQRLMQAAWFQTWLRTAVIRPVLLLAVMWLLWAVWRDRLPDGTPQIAQLRSQLKAQLDAPVSRRLRDRERLVGQTMTWGTTGVGVVMLTAIITADALNPALGVATAAFAVSVPFLVVLGFLFLLQSDPQSPLPTVRTALLQTTLLHAAHLVFYFGFAALLWSYDPRIAALFVVACYLAWRYLQPFLLRHAASGAAPGD